MAGRLRKCQICGESINPNEEQLKYKNGYAHKKCFDLAMKIVVTDKKEKLAKAKKKTTTAPSTKPLKDGLSEEEYQDKCRLCDYIKQLTQEDFSVATFKLIEDYKKKYKISYYEMYQDLKWYFDLGEHAVEGDMVIAMVPMCHTQAQKYYKEIEEANASCQENLEKIPSMYKQKVAAVSRKRRSPVPEIDIAAIGGEKNS